ARNPFAGADGEPARAVCTALCRSGAGRKIRRLLGKGQPEVRRPLGDGGSGRATAKGFGPARAVAQHRQTTTPGARILQRLGRSVEMGQRRGGAGNRPYVRPGTRVVGAARFPHGIPSRPLWAVSLSRGWRRIPFGAALGRGFAASEPSAERFRRARSGSPFLGSKPALRRQFFFVPIASGSRSFPLCFDPPLCACRSGRISPPPIRTEVFGDRPALSRFSGPGIGTEQRSDCRG